MTTTHFNQSLITPNFLEKSRMEGDVLADNTIQLIIEHGDLAILNTVFLQLVNNHSLSDELFKDFDLNIQKALKAYFTESAAMPSWYDQQKVQLGESVFAEYGPAVFMLLNVSSLPMCYTCAKGAQVLYDTGRLMTHHEDIDALSRRLMETGQMIFNVLSPGGLSDGGAGVITIQKVRLIHASIRYYLLNKPKENGYTWDIEQYGLPINQEDLAGTLMSFGPVILNGLSKLDIQLSEEQTDAYMHCWQVVGHLMGVKDALNPSTYLQGFELASSILKHQASASEAGQKLTESCITFLQHHVPGNLFDKVPAFMMEYFLADFSQASNKDLASILALKNDDTTLNKISLRLSKYISKDLSALEKHKFIQHLSAVFNKALLEGVIKHFNGNKSVHFFIPPSLTKNWNMSTSI